MTSIIKSSKNKIKTTKHICPACGKKYNLYNNSVRPLKNPLEYELPCTFICAERLSALETWLSKRRF